MQWPNYFFIVLACLQVAAISHWLKIIVADYVAVEIAEAFPLPSENVMLKENSHSVLGVAVQRFVPQVFYYTKAARSRE